MVYRYISIHAKHYNPQYFLLYKWIFWFTEAMYEMSQDIDRRGIIKGLGFYIMYNIGLQNIFGFPK